MTAANDTMNLRSHTLSLLAAVLAASAAPTQEPGRLTTPSAVSTDRIAVHSHPQEAGEPAYGLWAAGEGYKASFDDGMTFVPYLGRAYPHNQPFAWQTTSVRVGEHELLVPSKGPTRTHTDFHVAFDHGAVVEAYDVLERGLEQTFVLAQRPPGDGDLVVRGALTTALQTAPVEGVHGDLTFFDAHGQPILTYGRAVAIDKDGDRFAMTTTCANGVVQLRLPAADLRRVDFPLTVDPLLARVTLDTLASTVAPGETDTCVAQDQTGYDTATATTRYASAADGDLVTYLSTSTLNGAGVAFSQIGTNLSIEHPSIASAAGLNRWVVVYQRLTVSTQAMTLGAAMFPQGSLPVAATFTTMLQPGNTHAWRPSIGGTENDAAGSLCLVAYQRETGAQFTNNSSSDVVGTIFNPQGTGSWGAPFRIDGALPYDTERPSVNRARGAEGSAQWFVAYQQIENVSIGFQDDWDVYGRLVSTTGAVSTNYWASSHGNVHKLAPHVDGRFGRFCVTFSTASTSLGKVLDASGTELRCERVDWESGAATPNAATDRPAELISSNQFRLLEPTGIAVNGNTRSHWTIGWRINATAPSVYATRVGFQGKTLQTADQVYFQFSSAPSSLGVAHDDQLGYSTLTWSIDAPTTSLFGCNTVLPTAATPTIYGAGCSNAGISWQGPTVSVLADHQRIGHELAGPAAFSAPAGALHLMLLATASANAPLVDPIVGSGCTLLVPLAGPDYLGMFPLGIGANVQWRLPLPENLPNTTIYMQDWILEADGRLYGTQGLQVQLVH